MNYMETTEYLDSLNGLGSRPGLENISELLTRLETRRIKCGPFILQAPTEKAP